MFNEIIKCVQKDLIGWGILIEAVILAIFNFIYLNHSGTDFLKDIFNRSIPEIIAILTASILGLGYIYLLGYFSMRKLNKFPISYGTSIKESILYQGSVFFLSIFLPFLFLYLSNHKQQNLFWYILINTAFVFSFGFVNEFVVNHGKSIQNPYIQKLTLKTIDSERHNLQLIYNNEARYHFKDESNEVLIVPIEMIKEIKWKEHQDNQRND